MPKRDKKKKWNFFDHEVLHSAHIALEVFDNHVAQHQTVRKNHKLRKQAEKVVDALYDFYQAAARTKD